MQCRITVFPAEPDEKLAVGGHGGHYVLGRRPLGFARRRNKIADATWHWAKSRWRIFAALLLVKTNAGLRQMAANPSGYGHFCLRLLCRLPHMTFGFPHRFRCIRGLDHYIHQGLLGLDIALYSLPGQFAQLQRREWLQ